MSNVKTAISILWFLFTVVIGSYYFVLTNDVQNLEKSWLKLTATLKTIFATFTFWKQTGANLTIPNA